MNLYTYTRHISHYKKRKGCGCEDAMIHNCHWLTGILEISFRSKIRVPCDIPWRFCFRVVSVLRCIELQSREMIWKGKLKWHNHVFTLCIINHLCFINLDIGFLEFIFCKKRTCRMLQKRRYLSLCANNGSHVILSYAMIYWNFINRILFIWKWLTLTNHFRRWLYSWAVSVNDSTVKRVHLQDTWMI